MAFLRQWVNTIRYNGPKGGPCLACKKETSCKLNETKYYFECSYCGLCLSGELVYAACSDTKYYATSFTQGPPPHAAMLIHQLERRWQQRWELLQEAGTEVLIELLNQRGFNIKIAKFELGQADWLKENPPMLPEPTTEPKPPKPWSYEDRAASEFNVKPDTSGLI